MTDEHGFRHAGDLDELKAEGELRIFLLGGPVAVNGMTNESTICGVLERLVSGEALASAFYELTNAKPASAAEQGHHAISLDGLLDDDDLFFDSIHTHDAGNERIAKALFEELERSGAPASTPPD